MTPLSATARPASPPRRDDPAFCLKNIYFSPVLSLFTDYCLLLQDATIFAHLDITKFITINNNFMNLRKLFVAAVLFVAGLAQAQMMPPIPVDPDVRIGKLDNGLTYYIRHNNWPENRANFYIEIGRAHV